MKKFITYTFFIYLTFSILSPLFADDAAIAHFQKAFTYQSSGLNEQAIAEYKTGLALEPDNTKALYNLAYIYYQANQFREASQGFQRVVELTPDNGDATAALAVCYASLEQYEKALKYADKAVELKHPQAAMLVTQLESWRPQEFEVEYASPQHPMDKVKIKFRGPRAAIGDDVLLVDILRYIEIGHGATPNTPFQAIDAKFLGWGGNNHEIVNKQWDVTWRDGTKTPYSVKTIPSPQGGTDFAIQEIK